MSRRWVPAACAAVMLLSVAVPARAQWGWGWGGWGGGETAFGANARGAGIFAMGAGQYNLDTAQARSINVDTTMRFNEYLWESQQVKNQQYYKKLAERRQRVNESAETTYKRLSENPESADVYRGDALNVILDQITKPGVYTQSVSAASKAIDSKMVKDVPLAYAPQAITISLDELTDAQPPDCIRDPRLQTERKAVRALVDQAHAEIDKNDRIEPDTLSKLQAAIKTFHARFVQVFPQGDPNRREGENFIKAVYGLTKMLEQPDVDTFLRGLDKVPTTTMGNLIGFMHTFNLRFGPAQTPRQRNVYDELYVNLKTLRDQVFPQGAVPSPLAVTTHTDGAARTQQFFSGMEMDQVRPRGAGATPAPPTPGN